MSVEQLSRHIRETANQSSEIQKNLFCQKLLADKARLHALLQNFETTLNSFINSALLGVDLQQAVPHTLSRVLYDLDLSTYSPKLKVYTQNVKLSVLVWMDLTTEKNGWI